MSETPRVLVVYSSRHGATAGIAERIADRLTAAGNRVDLRHVDEAGSVVGACDAVVMGHPVYDQRWPPEAEAFVREHAEALASRPLWLFSVGSFGDTRRLLGRLATKEPADIEEIRARIRPRRYRVFAGVVEGRHWPRPARVLFRLARLRFGDNRDWPEIERWADEIATAMRDPTAAPASSRV